jgi:hypothetical protein
MELPIAYILICLGENQIKEKSKLAYISFALGAIIAGKFLGKGLGWW